MNLGQWDLSSQLQTEAEHILHHNDKKPGEIFKCLRISGIARESLSFIRRKCESVSRAPRYQIKSPPPRAASLLFRWLDLSGLSPSPSALRPRTNSTCSFIAFFRLLRNVEIQIPQICPKLRTNARQTCATTLPRDDLLQQDTSV